VNFLTNSEALNFSQALPVVWTSLVVVLAVGIILVRQSSNRWRSDVYNERGLLVLELPFLDT
jgi:hypothetical protein